MTRLVFDAAEVRRIIEHVLSAREHQRKVIDYDKELKPVTEPGKPAIVLVHDHGVYLMSNGLPRDLIDPLASQEDGRSFVAYAKGCNPDTDGDWWDVSRELVGGDDFAETLPWVEAMKQRLDAGAKTIVLNVGKKSISLR